jgi:hemoglobin/transferrin/lactoferrin receptor protein
MVGTLMTKPTTARLRVALSTSVALAALGALAAPAQAADAWANVELAALLDPVTVTATRSEKKVDEVPATVSVITSQRVEDELATDIKDLIRFEPGVSVRNSPSRFTAAGASTGRDGNSGFNIRGLEGNRVLIVVDGVRVPDSYSFGAQAMGRGDYVDLDVLKSVEILRGPASALYGSDGVAGAVSFVTKDPRDYLTGDKPWSMQARAAYASADESLSKTLAAAGKVGDWSALVSYTRRDGSEQKTDGSNHAPNITRTAANPQDVFSNALLAKLMFEPDDHNRLRLTLDHDDHKADTNVLSAVAAPPLASTSALHLNASDSTRRNRVSFDHRYVADGGLIDEAHSSVYWQQAKTIQYSTEDRNTAADRTRIGTFDTRVAGVAVELKSHFATGEVQHAVVYGGDYSATRQTGFRDGAVPPVGESFPTKAFPNTDFTLAGVYLQDEIALLGGRLSAYPAVRYDHYKLDPSTGDPLFTGAVPAGQSKSHLSPKIGLVFDATPQLGLFVNYGAGFKPPAPNQVNNGFANLVSNYRSVSNPDLKPETSKTFEGGVRLHGEAWNASATAFTGDYKDFITQVQTSGNFTPTNPAIYQFINLGSVRISGLEARGQAALGAGFSLNLAGAYARGTSTSAGVKAPLDSIDPVKVVAGLAWREAEGQFGGQIILTHSQGKSQGRAGGTCGTTCFTPKAFTILDATGYWNINKTATVRAGIFNITNQKYWWWSDVRGLTQSSTVLDAYTQPGRNAGISLTMRL